MKATTIAVASTVLALAATTLPHSAARADTFIFNATSDFPIIDAGAVPYYSESPGRPSLAINAAREDYRNQFARATMRYEGESDFYDITLTGLAELDGEALYQVLINDVVVGTATNPEVDVDYTPIKHVFEDIVVPHGSTIAVESLANTNGKIPEGDSTAYARGRWTTLQLDNDDAGTAAEDDVDLTLNASMDSDTVRVGDVFTLTLDISNSEDGAVATTPQFSLTRPRAEVALASETTLSCLESGNDIICELSEIAAGDSRRVSVSLEALAVSPNALLRATISADQDDSNTDDNVVTLPLSISANTDGTDTPDSEEGIDEGTDPDQPDSQEPDGEDSGSQAPGNEETDTTTDGGTRSSRSGGGAISAWMLFLIAVIRKNASRVPGRESGRQPGGERCQGLAHSRTRL